MANIGGCGCTGGARRTRKHKTHMRKSRKTKKGGSLVGDAILAGSALGLYSYFKKKGGASTRRSLPKRKTQKALV
jgi:hypothetical protein